jgi:hypothetical protein
MRTQMPGRSRKVLVMQESARDVAGEVHVCISDPGTLNDRTEFAIYVDRDDLADAVRRLGFEVIDWRKRVPEDEDDDLCRSCGYRHAP